MTRVPMQLFGNCIMLLMETQVGLMVPASPASCRLCQYHMGSYDLVKVCAMARLLTWQACVCVCRAMGAWGA